MSAKYCQDEFDSLAMDDPHRLLGMITHGSLSDVVELSFAAEAAGRIADTALVTNALLPLLKHPEAVVREGAIYGLMPHTYSSPEAREAIKEVMRHDTSSGVRFAASDALLFYQSDR